MLGIACSSARKLFLVCKFQHSIFVNFKHKKNVNIDFRPFHWTIILNSEIMHSKKSHPVWIAKSESNPNRSIPRSTLLENSSHPSKSLSISTNPFSPLSEKTEFSEPDLMVPSTPPQTGSESPNQISEPESKLGNLARSPLNPPESSELNQISEPNSEARSTHSLGITLEDPSDSSSSSVKSGVKSPLTQISPRTKASASGKNKIDLGVGKLLATFYPKFENTNAEREVRAQLLKTVEAGEGVLEVSVKHSGSLFMWSGAQKGAFAKNSFGNEYTAVGVWVLAETLKRAWGEEKVQSVQSNLNEFVQKHNLSISMELVTAVLGDHGQRPLQDYVVVTAICDLTHKPKFYSTHDIIRFCRIWRLPSNQYWLFHSKEKIHQYFTAYEALNEEGTARTVEETLNGIADIAIPGTAVHTLLQGEIMEGLVARLVSNSSVSKMSQILQHYPPHTHLGGAAGAGERLRKIFSSPSLDLSQKTTILVDEAGPYLCTKSDWFPATSAESSGYGRKEDISSHSSLGRFLHSTPADSTTAKIQYLIHSVQKRKMPLQFKCKSRPLIKSSNLIQDLFKHNEILTPGMLSLDDLPSTVSDQFIITVHAYSDSAFRIYRNMMKDNPKLWPLFRGFFIEANVLQIDSNKKKYFDQVSDTDDVAIVQSDEFRTTSDVEKLNNETVRVLGEIEETPLVDEMKHLMLKMKFLPYKIRTFLIRNGLSSLINGGHQKYKEHYSRLIKSWDTSPAKAKQLSHLCDSWANHLLKHGKEKIKSDSYLDIAEPFLRNFAEISQKNARLVGDFDVTTSFSKLTLKETESDEEVEEEASYKVSKEISPKKFQGLLVFFPGIPGCAKSALCQKLVSDKNLGDGRKLDSLMGDLTKGKYWRILSDRRAKNKAVNTLADKNAPTVEVWEQIDIICNKTEALGVPVIPESTGTSSNPYDEEVLSVFMYRVLQRENHPGNLDKASHTPAYVVLLFYNLYAGKDREMFESNLKGKFGLFVTMPVLKHDRPPFPDEIRDLIEKGQNLFNRFKSKHGRAEPVNTDMKDEFLKWEKNVSTLFSKYSKYMESIQVPFEEVVEVVKKQLSDIACGRIIPSPPITDSDFSLAKSLRMASLKIEKKFIMNALKELGEQNEEARKFIQAKKEEIEKKEDFHVTLAHRSHGLSTLTKFTKFQGTTVEVQVMHFLFGKNTAALSVEWNEKYKQKGIQCCNEFPHITIWTAKGVPAKRANELPRQVKSESANEIKFSKPIIVNGVVGFA